MRRGWVSAGALLAAIALLLLQNARPAAAGCNQGDLPCFCRGAGGYWESPPPPLLQTCKFKLNWQGRERSVNVYLPPSYKADGSNPMWVHLHGVFWGSMGGIKSQVNGWPVQAADATALWDKLVGGAAHRAGVIIVYPQSTGDAGTRQFFNNGYWTCSVGVCADKSVDDIGFLEQVVSRVPAAFKADPGRIFLSGKSAGGMMVHAALCKSAAITSRVKVAVDILGSIPEPMAADCAPRGATNVMLIHGEQDEHLPWARPVVLDYVPFLSKQAAAGFWSGKYSLPSKWSQQLNGGQYECTYYSGGGGSGGGGKKVALCGIKNAGHTTDIPYVGAPFDLAWDTMRGALK